METRWDQINGNRAFQRVHMVTATSSKNTIVVNLLTRAWNSNTELQTSTGLSRSSKINSPKMDSQPH